MDALRKVEAVQDITLMLHEQARLADLNRPDEQVLCFTEDVVADYYGEQLFGRDAIHALLIPALNRWVASSHSISNIQMSPWCIIDKFSQKTRGCDCASIGPTNIFYVGNM